VSGVGFSIELLARLKDTFPTQFAGIKDSSHNKDFACSLGQKFGDDLAVFSGTDSDFSLALQNQAAGCITAPANLISPGLRDIYDSFVTGKEFKTAQSKVSAQRDILEKYQPFPALLKALLARLYEQPRWCVRPPLTEILKAEEDKAVQELTIN